MIGRMAGNAARGWRLNKRMAGIRSRHSPVV